MESQQDDIAIAHSRKLQNQNSQSDFKAMRWAQLFAAGFLLIAIIAGASCPTLAQNKLPFEVSNPKHKKWSADQAGRIYTSACDLLARTIRPEKPPQLHPKFLLVLGADNDEFVRMGSEVEIRLKSWSPPKFAEAVVMVAARDVLQASDLKNIVRQSLSLAHATVSVSELRESW